MAGTCAVSYNYGVINLQLSLLSFLVFLAAFIMAVNAPNSSAPRNMAP